MLVCTTGGGKDGVDLVIRWMMPETVSVLSSSTRLFWRLFWRLSKK